MKFDSSLGFPGEGPTANAIDVVSYNLGGAGSAQHANKWHDLISWIELPENKFDIICVQETKSPYSGYAAYLLRYSNFMIYDVANINNHVKGGTAILVR